MYTKYIILTLVMQEIKRNKMIFFEKVIFVFSLVSNLWHFVLHYILKRNLKKVKMKKIHLKYLLQQFIYG